MLSVVKAAISAVPKDASWEVVNVATLAEV